MKLNLIKNESADWFVLKVNGLVFHEGHDVPEHIWIEIVENLGAEVVQKEISDEEMENGDY